MTKLERRAFALDELRIDAPADGKRTIRGHAAIFNTLSVDLGGFREKIEPGAFATSIAKDDVRALFNHDPNYVLGRNTAKSQTLRLAEDERGLAIENDPPDTQWANDLLVSMERGDITQMSFGFVAIRDRWEFGEDQETIRTLLEVQLYDVSPVTFPAYPDTDVGVRSMADIALEGIRALAKLREGRSIDIMRRRIRLAEIGL